MLYENHNDHTHFKRRYHSKFVMITQITLKSTMKKNEKEILKSFWCALSVMAIRSFAFSQETFQF